MKLCMIGTGYVGLVSGVCFADIGNQVVCVDKDKNKIDKLNSGISPIYEPGLDELIKKNFTAKRLSFTTNINRAISTSDIISLDLFPNPIIFPRKINLSPKLKFDKIYFLIE